MCEFTNKTKPDQIDFQSIEFQRNRFCCFLFLMADNNINNYEDEFI